MACFVCETCGVQYEAADRPPAVCRICSDERQYVGWRGQTWTHLPAMHAAGYVNRFQTEEPGLTSIVTTPSFAIGQRALLVQTPGGNLLWDCLTLLDDATIGAVCALGGVAAIAISHPHYYGAMVEWSHAFDNAPIYLHAADRDWVTRTSPALVFWEGETIRPLPTIELIALGGHFPGGTVAHWTGTSDGEGVLLSGDIVQVVQDRQHVSFMYSYPNLIPLPTVTVARIAATLRRYAFDRIYGAFPHREIRTNARAAVQRSAERYLRLVTGPDIAPVRQTIDA
ncbi:MAG: MBL fold metallo-hydrolase [Dehalococcoidia bacterium]|nr:MBL fold metallo-hydrolase [Dehalococcoidia bacterium]